jgi:hypothetical protein
VFGDKTSSTTLDERLKMKELAIRELTERPNEHHSMTSIYKVIINEMYDVSILNNVEIAQALKRVENTLRCWLRSEDSPERSETLIGLINDRNFTGLKGETAPRGWWKNKAGMTTSEDVVGDNIIKEVEVNKETEVKPAVNRKIVAVDPDMEESINILVDALEEATAPLKIQMDALEEDVSFLESSQEDNRIMLLELVDRTAELENKVERKADKEEYTALKMRVDALSNISNSWQGMLNRFKKRFATEEAVERFRAKNK